MCKVVKKILTECRDSFEFLIDTDDLCRDSFGKLHRSNEEYVKFEFRLKVIQILRKNPQKIK